jgi:hypothetical protein
LVIRAWSVVVQTRALAEPSRKSRNGLAPEAGPSKTMKTFGEKCGWVIPRKERRVLKLLRTHACELDREFVAQSPSVPRRKARMKIQVEFAPEELSAFHPLVRIVTRPDAKAGS